MCLELLLKANDVEEAMLNPAIGRSTGGVLNLQLSYRRFGVRHITNLVAVHVDIVLRNLLKLKVSFMDSFRVDAAVGR